VRTEGEVRAAVVTIAVDEHRLFWVDPGTGALRAESEDNQFEHLVRYWLFVHPSIWSQHLDAISAVLGDKSVTPANRFLRLLNPANEPPANISADAATVAQALIAGIPDPPPPLQAIVEDALKKAREIRLGNGRWAGPFLNTCVREAERNLNFEGPGPFGYQQKLLATSLTGEPWEWGQGSSPTKVRLPSCGCDIRS
jgi:hypothetical protein